MTILQATPPGGTDEPENQPSTSLDALARELRATYRLTARLGRAHDRLERRAKAISARESEAGDLNDEVRRALIEGIVATEQVLIPEDGYRWYHDDATLWAGWIDGRLWVMVRDPEANRPDERNPIADSVKLAYFRPEHLAVVREGGDR